MTTNRLTLVYVQSTHYRCCSRCMPCPHTTVPVCTHAAAAAAAEAAACLLARIDAFKSFPENTCASLRGQVTVSYSRPARPWYHWTQRALPPTYVSRQTRFRVPKTRAPLQQTHGRVLCAIMLLLTTLLILIAHLWPRCCSLVSLDAFGVVPDLPQPEGVVEGARQHVLPVRRECRERPAGVVS